MKVYLRLKGARFGSLGHVVSTGYWCDDGTLLVTKRYMSIFLKRMWEYNKYLIQIRNVDTNWDDLFCHVISHEYMHNAIYKVAGLKVSSKFDIFMHNANIVKNAKYIGLGMNIIKEE